MLPLNSGFNDIHSKDDNSLYNGKDIQLIPAKAGLKYFLVSFLYIQGEAGASFLTNKNGIGVDKKETFVYAPRLVYCLTSVEKIISMLVSGLKVTPNYTTPAKQITF